MDKNRDNKCKVGYESRTSTTGSRVNKPKKKDVGQVTTVPGRGLTVWDEGRRSPTKGRKYPMIERNSTNGRVERGPSMWVHGGPSDPELEHVTIALCK